MNNTAPNEQLLDLLVEAQVTADRIMNDTKFLIDQEAKKRINTDIHILVRDLGVIRLELQEKGVIR